jgi:hypothetical protein
MRSLGSELIWGRPLGIGKPWAGEVMNVYLTEHAPNKPSARNIADFAADILLWWGPRPLSDVNGRNCRA